MCGHCGGDANSIISVFTQLHRSGFMLEMPLARRCEGTSFGEILDGMLLQFSWNSVIQNFNFGPKQNTML